MKVSSSLIFIEVEWISPNGSDYQYEYTLKDHLGNARVSFADLDNDGTVDQSEILQTNHYYPFGMVRQEAV